MLSASSAPGLEVVRSSPYKGLVPYSEADAAFFFGRSTERDIVVANLLASRLTLLYGASGVGKSSLLQAGVASYLRRGPKPSRTARRSPELVVVFDRWTGDPVRDLIVQIDRTCAEAGLDDAAAASETGDASATLPETLQRWSARLDVAFLIVLDQFEEYFLYHEHEDGADTFAVQFPSAVNRADLRANFLVAMREDQLARLDRFKGRIPQLFDNTLRITHLGYQAARAAIEQPLDAYNRLAPGEHHVTVQPEVIDTILEDVRVGRVQLTERGQGGTGNGPGESASNSPIEAPYLQLVMTTLWAEERRSGSQVLRAETLRSLGGAQRIVRTHLADAMDSLNRQEQDVAAAVFRYLVTPSGSKISYSDQDLADYAGLPQTVVAPVLQKLSSGDVRILRPVGDSLRRTGGSNYEIFHDVLAPAILDWRSRYVQQRAAEQELARRMEHEAAERRAVEEQARIYRRRAQRRGAFALGMALVLVVVVALAVVSVQRTSEARRANNAAQASALSSQATALLMTDPAESARRAAEALELDRSAPDAELVLREALGASHIRQIISRNGRSMTGAAFSRDGRHIVTAGDAGTVSVHSLDAREPVRTLSIGGASNLRSPPAFVADDQAVVATTLSGQTYLWRWKSGSGADKPLVTNVVATAVDPGNDRVATADRGGMIQVWDSSGRRRGRLSGGRAFVSSLAFSPDGTLLASGGQLGLSLWDRAKEDKLPPDSGAVSSVAFSSDGNYLAAAGDGGVKVWAAAGGTWEPKELSGAGSAGGRIVRFSPKGHRLAIVRGSVVEVWNVKDGSREAVLSGHSDSILNVAFNDDGNQVITAGTDATARVWEVLDGEALLYLRGHAGAVFDARFSPDGKQAVTTGADGTVRLWDVSTGSSLPKRHFAPAQSAAFGPMGTAVTASADTTSCLIHDLGGGSPPCPFIKDHERAERDRSVVMDARISADGRNVITAHSDGTVAVWRIGGKDKTPLLTTQPDKRFPVNSAAVSPNGDEIAFGAGVKLYLWTWRHAGSPPSGFSWRADDSEQLFVNDSILDVQFGPGRYSNLVLTAHADGEARLWSWKTDSSGRKTGLPVRPFKSGSDVTYEAKFSPAGDRIVTANGDGVARVWDTASGRLLHELKNVSGRALTSVNVSPDGNWVVAGDTGGDVLVWEVASTKLLAVLPRHAGAVNSVQFSPAGDGRILSAGDDGGIRVSTCTTCGSVDDLLVAAEHLAR
jgi:WD40 repeat protein